MAPNLLGHASSILLPPAPEVAESPEPIQILKKTQTKQGLETSIQPSIFRKPSNPKYKWQMVWRNVIAFVYLHTFMIYGLWLCFTSAQWKTVIFGFSYGIIASQGITAGAHRLWAHRTYKAKLPLRIFLCILQTASFQNHIYEWVRDHRVHHKFTDTDADPHNAKRGFFFSHIGWLMVKKHKDVFTKGRTVDLSDLEADPVVMFQKKYYLLFMPLLCFVVPTFIPYHFWNESFWTSWYICGVMRYTLSLNITWLVNSAAHIWGTKPYDKTIMATENKFVAAVGFGEGWHNYHHIFPWDYKAAELGDYRMNISTAFLDFMAHLGLAYDLKTASHEMVNKRSQRTGDGTRKIPDDFVDSNNQTHEHPTGADALWGWGDRDMKEEEIEEVLEYNHIKSR